MMASGSKDVVKPEVASGIFRLGPSKHKVDLHIVYPAISGRHPAKIRLVRSDGHKGVAAASEGLANKKVQLARLVPTETESRKIVSLAEYPAARHFRQGHQLVHRRRQ